MATTTQAVKSKTLTKREVIEYLGKSKRTVETYISAGRLPVAYVNGPNGKQATFERGEVERFKREMAEPMVRAVVPAGSNDTAHPGSTAVGPLVRTDALQHFLASVLQAYPAQRPKPWLTLAEAAEFSGLPQSYLLTQARAGSIRAVNVGTPKQQRWRFHRAGLAK
jgi:hypothetical protein